MKLTRLAASLAATVGVAGTLALGGSPAANATPYPACGNNSLAVTRSYVDAGMGHRWMYLLFRNRTSTACTTNGFPATTALNASYGVMAHATHVGTVHPIVIPPGRYAVAALEWSAFNSTATGPCPRWSTYLKVIPPNTTHPSLLRQSVSTCQLQVQPIESAMNVSGLTFYAYAQGWWIRGASATDVMRGSDWFHAEANLKVDGSLYAYQVKELEELIAMPDTGLTPTQRAKVIALTKSLNAFFGTPGLYF